MGTRQGGRGRRLREEGGAVCGAKNPVSGRAFVFAKWDGWSYRYARTEDTASDAEGNRPSEANTQVFGEVQNGPS